MAAPTRSRNGPFPVRSGAPDVGLLVCRPAPADGPVPALYYIHGGGMIAGPPATRRRLLDLAEHVGAARGVGRVPAGARRRRTRARSRTATPAWSGWPSTPTSSGSTRRRIVLVGGSAGGGLAAGRRAARPRPRRPGAGRPAADVPDARRPQRHAVGAPDGRAADVEPAGERGRLDGAARRRAAAARDVSPYAAPARAEDLSGLPPDVRRRRLRGHLPRRGRRLREPHLAGRRRSPNCTSGRAASTASTASPRTRRSRRQPSPPARTGSAACWAMSGV